MFMTHTNRRHAPLSVGLWIEGPIGAKQFGKSYDYRNCYYHAKYDFRLMLRVWSWGDVFRFYLCFFVWSFLVFSSGSVKPTSHKMPLIKSHNFVI